MSDRPQIGARKPRKKRDFKADMEKLTELEMELNQLFQHFSFAHNKIVNVEVEGKSAVIGRPPVPRLNITLFEKVR